MEPENQQKWYIIICYNKIIILDHIISLSQLTQNQVHKDKATLSPVCLSWHCILLIFVNTLRLRQDGCHFTDGIFKHIFLNENFKISIEISLKFIPIGPINNVSALVQIMTRHWPGNKPSSEPMMIILLTYIFASLSLNELTVHNK